MKRTQLAAAIVMATSSMSALAATYTVTPLPVTDIGKSNFAKSIDNTGAMLTTVKNEFNPPIDLELAEDSGLLALNENLFESPEDAEAGNFTSLDYQRIVNSLLTYSATNSDDFQHLTNFRSYVTDTVDASLVPGLDVIDEDSGRYTHSVETIARDSISRDYIVGSSAYPFLRLDYTNEDDEDVYYLLSEGLEQAFAEVNGNHIRLPSPDDTLNGYAAAYSINNNLQVAGYATTSFTDAAIETIENCADDEERGDIPYEKCIQDIVYTDSSTSTSTVRFPLREVSQIRPVVWQLDGAGNVIDITSYPLVFDPTEDQLLSLKIGRAYAINDQGVAVGVSQTDEGSAVAVSLIDGQTTEFLPRGENNNSSAIAINNENWVTGYVNRSPNGVSRNRLFVHNLDTGESVYPDGFYSNAPTEANAINNNNIVVGKSEVDTSSSSSLSDTHAFMYTVGDEELTDLNTLISCDSEYELVEAVDINDSDEIIANALIQRPQRYIDGEAVINSAGEQEEEDLIVAVKLTPNGDGEIEQCDIDDEGSDEEAGYERSGASTQWSILALLAGAVVWRRKMVSKATTFLAKK